MIDQTKCCFCGENNEEWPGGGGYGNNPAPVSVPEGSRCCRSCNMNVVLPLRFRMYHESISSAKEE